jgi:hypothetical protein
MYALHSFFAVGPVQMGVFRAGLVMVRMLLMAHILRLSCPGKFPLDVLRPGEWCARSQEMICWNTRQHDRCSRQMLTSTE